MTDNPKTFTQLDNEINESQDTFEINYDYTFNNETDSNYASGITINKSNFVIDGNGHSINGNNQAKIFRITGGNITINNLFLVNGNSDMGGAIFSSGKLTLNNVTFINNTASKIGGAIASNGLFECNNSKFIDNYVDINSTDCGAAMAFSNSEANIYNTYITSKIPTKLSQIQIVTSKLNLDNVTFDNLIASYGPALYISFSSDTRIRNAKFINLTANKTAGAIIIKSGGNTVIENCEFINTTSSKDAGAIYADISGQNYDGSPSEHGNLSIINSRFENTSSGFGGALIQLGGKLFINHSEFVNSKTIFNGGSVYISFVDAKINNCTFDSNEAGIIKNIYTFGGALYSDYSELLLTNSKFIDNLAICGNAIYAIDTSYNITNSTFINNTNAIYTEFDRESYLGDNNLYNGDSVSTNNTYYNNARTFGGIELPLANNTINVTNLPSRYDSRDWGWVSDVKNQGLSGSCWTFGMTGTLESALLRAYGLKIDLSQNNMRNTMLKYSIYGNKQLVEEGMATSSLSYLVSWLGAFSEYYDSYDEFGKISPAYTNNATTHIQDAIFVSNFPKDNGTYIKSAILNYGSVDASFFGQASINDENQYYNPKTSAQYCDEYNPANHEISIIGWDDHYSKDNFLIPPPDNGAWIIKNSYGKNWGNDGFLYVSYYDKTLSVSTSIDEYAVGIIIENTVPYNRNYQYDTIWAGDFITGENICYANQFRALEDDLIAGVGTYFPSENINYTIEIYVNNELKLTQKGVSPYFGYHTIKLDKYIPIKEGDLFYAAVTSNSVPVVNLSDVRTHSTHGFSLIYRNGTWIDLYDEGKIANLKIYTVHDDTKIINNKDIAVDYAGGGYFKVKVVTAEGHSVGAGEVVKFTINGKTTTVKTDKNGIAKIKITDVPKKYTITTTFNGKTYKNTVTVKQVLTTSKITVKKTAKKFTLKTKLKINGKLQKGKWITFKFNGKTYKVKTNSKGIAKKTLNKKVIKKLKKGKKYPVKVVYLKDTIKTIVEVK